MTRGESIGVLFSRGMNHHRAGNAVQRRAAQSLAICAVDDKCYVGLVMGVPRQFARIVVARVRNHESADAPLRDTAAEELTAGELRTRAHVTCVR